MENDAFGFAIARVDRLGQLPSTYLRSFALTGRKGLRELAFGAPAAAHLFERRDEAEEVARRLRRRVSSKDFDYVVEEMSRNAVVPA
jgi:hypothetical protein